MITALIARGVAAGLLAGLLVGFFALGFGEPPVDAAIAIEEAHADAPDVDVAAAGPHAHADADEISRGTQKIGLVCGMALYGTALGLAFGWLATWARGRVRGDVWTRSLKLGAAALFVLVLFPALKYPPNPPSVGDPDTIDQRTLLYLGTWLLGVLLVTFGWNATRVLTSRAWSPPAAQCAVGAALVAVAGGLLALLPDLPPVRDFPADLLWTFRIRSLVLQTLLISGLAMLHGLFNSWAEQRSSVSRRDLRAA